MGSEAFKTFTFQQLIDDGSLEIGDGYRARNSELGGGGPIFLRAGHVTDSHIDFDGVEHFNAELADKLRHKMAQPGDTIVTTKGNSTGRTSFATRKMPPFVYSPHLSYWRSIDASRVENGFLRYWSRGPEFSRQLVGMKASTDMAPYLSLTDQRRLKITLPQIGQQRAIAHILGTLDDKIELNRRMNATLEALARALFKSWFVDFDPVRAKMDGRQPAGMDAETARLFPDRLEHAELGLVPKGWRYCHLEETLSTLETGSRPKGGVSGITTGIPSVGAESIVGIGKFNFEKTKYVPSDFYHAMRRGHVESRDVLLYKDGGRPGEYEPHVSMFGDGFPFPQLCINEHVYRLRGNHMAGQAYLYLWLTTDGLLEEMRVKGTGVAIPGLNSTAVKSLTVLVPTRDVMDLLESTLGCFVGRILSNSKQSQSLATLRDTLLPKLLSGELRVSEAERQLESAL